MFYQYTVDGECGRGQVSARAPVVMVSGCDSVNVTTQRLVNTETNASEIVQNMSRVC